MQAPTRTFQMRGRTEDVDRLYELRGRYRQARGLRNDDELVRLFARVLEDVLDGDDVDHVVEVERHMRAIRSELDAILAARAVDGLMADHAREGSA